MYLSQRQIRLLISFQLKELIQIRLDAKWYEKQWDSSFWFKQIFTQSVVFLKAPTSFQKRSIHSATVDIHFLELNSISNGIEYRRKHAQNRIVLYSRIYKNGNVPKLWFACAHLCNFHAKWRWQRWSRKDFPKNWVDIEEISCYMLLEDRSASIFFALEIS